MNKDLFVYFLLLLVPLCVLPFAVHSFLTTELHRGREVGTAYLAAEAHHLVADMVATHAEKPELEKAQKPVLAEIVDADGKTADNKPFPADGRCFGDAPLAPVQPGKFLRVTWPGVRDLGKERVHERFVLEITAFGVCGFFILLGSGLLARAMVRSRHEARRQLEYVADFTHRLKTPLTSISLCAELTRKGRLDDARKQEAVETVIAEAAKLDVLVDEVMAHVKESRRA